MKTYAIVAPRSTHHRPATCAEVECEAWAHGWVTAVDERTELGQRQAGYIRTKSGRAYTMSGDADGRTVFTFKPGQSCFREHTVRLDRPELYVVREGDHRGNPRGAEPLVHKRARDWVDDFATHQERLADRLARG